jgi:hypothetical protein
MKKAFFFMLIVLCSFSAFAQHRVNDIKQYGGWYKVTMEITSTGKTSYFITQCYPSGEEHAVTGADREKLPLYMKVLCMGLVDEVISDSFGGITDMTFESDGMFLEVTTLSFTFTFKTTNSDEEMLVKFGEETVEQYRNRSWD